MTTQVLSSLCKRSSAVWPRGLHLLLIIMGELLGMEDLQSSSNLLVEVGRRKFTNTFFCTLLREHFNPDKVSISFTNPDE